MTGSITASGYYAPLSQTETFQPSPAWTITIGITPSGEWVAEFQSAASPRYQREYFATREAALRRATNWV